MEEPQESCLEPSESHVHVTVLTFCSQRKNLVICIKERTPIFLSNTERKEKRRKERGGGSGRDAFICRLPLKWTVSITAEEHMLYIILSFEYKSSWREACELGPSERLVTVNWMWPGSKAILHNKWHLACYVTKKYNKLSLAPLKWTTMSQYCCRCQIMEIKAWLDDIWRTWQTNNYVYSRYCHKISRTKSSSSSSRLPPFRAQDVSLTLAYTHVYWRFTATLATWHQWVAGSESPLLWFRGKYLSICNYFGTDRCTYSPWVHLSNYRSQHLFDLVTGMSRQLMASLGLTALMAL